MKNVKRTMTRIMAALMSAITVASAAAIQVSADVNWPSTSGIKTYVVSTGNNTTVYQTATSSSKYGTIYADDLITIKGGSNGRLKVTYPTSNGSKTGYIKMSDVTTQDFNNAKNSTRAGCYMTAYRRYTGSKTIGSVSEGDKIWILATKGDRTQVIYPISGGYKIGWVDSYLIGGQKNQDGLRFPLKGAITRSSSVKTDGVYCDYKTGGSVPVYAPCDGTVVYKQAYKTSNGTKKLSSYGNYIEFTSSDNVYKMKFAHLSSFNGVGLTITKSLSYPCSGSHGTLVLKTKTVKKGDLLGYSGMTGNASGHHLHLEVKQNGRTVDPASVFTSWN